MDRHSPVAKLQPRLARRVGEARAGWWEDMAQLLRANPAALIPTSSVQWLSLSLSLARRPGGAHPSMCGAERGVHGVEWAGRRAASAAEALYDTK